MTTLSFPPTAVLDVTTAGDGDWSGWELHGQARYRVPIPVLLGWDLVAPMLGITQGMIDEIYRPVSSEHPAPGGPPTLLLCIFACPRPPPSWTRDAH